MRHGMLGASFLLFSAAAAAQPAPAPQVPPNVQRVMADPATADRLADAIEALSGVFLDLPVGKVRAAVEGRKPTAADKRATLGSESGMSERELKARIAAARPVIHQSMKVLSEALPGMIAGLAQAQQSLERAAANMPDPNYPKR